MRRDGRDVQVPGPGLITVDLLQAEDIGVQPGEGGAQPRSVDPPIGRRETMQHIQGGDPHHMHATAPPAMPRLRCMTDLVRAYVEQHLADLHADLDAWLRIPSISTSPQHADEVRRGAQWFAEALTRTGFPTVRVWETGGHPAVYAHWPSSDPDAPRVVLYGHHDVQPVDPLALWDTPPFEPTVRGEDLFARGAIDDKGQLLFHLLGLRAHLAATGRTSPAVHLTVLAEGEEENGSPHFRELLLSHQSELGADVVVVSDTGVFDRDTPSICVGMRGLVSCQLELHGPDVD